MSWSRLSLGAPESPRKPLRLPRSSDNSPYRDENPAPRPDRGAGASRRHGSAGRKQAVSESAPRGATKQPARKRPSPAPKAKSARPRRGRRSGKASPDWSHAATARLTSHPTHRSAYAETRRWLLAEHGPVCAYCERKFKPSEMTLDHVAPRRGQSAYDRRDNLVLACPECNAAKRDMAPIAFLLARRSRAVSLLRYGGHLSPMLIDLARSLVPAATLATLASSASDDDGDDDSPYSD